MTGDANSVDRFILGTLPLQSQNCATDYIVIPVPTEIINGVSVALPGDRFCGLGIGAVTSKSRHSVEHYLNQIELNFFIFSGKNVPFNVHVVTDGSEIDDIANRGFYLNYSQGLCL